MRQFFISMFFVLFATMLFAQDGWDNWKPYSSESYYDIQKETSEKVESENYDIYKPKFYVTRMQNRFLSVDKFADKYPSMNPYHYTLNNPINFVDLNGDSVWINYTDSDGNAQRLLYTQGMEYSGGNEKVAALITSLNTLNSLSSGNTVLSSLTGSTANYNVQFGGGNVGGYLPDEIQQGSGGMITLTNPSNVYDASHEFFHAYQHENMNMINSTAFEVGAHLFETSVYSQLNQGIMPLDYLGGSQEFANAYENLLNNFNQKDFNTATRTFLQSSYNPGGITSGPYRRLQATIINNIVIQRFYPLIR